MKVSEAERRSQVSEETPLRSDRRGVLTGGALALMALGGANGTRAAANSRLETVTLETKLVPSPAAYGVLLPPGYGAQKGPYPLVLFLHGGDGYKGFLPNFRPAIEAAWATGELPPAVIVTPDARRSLYMDFKDGSEKWETFILGELLADVRRRFHVSSERSKTVVTGMSMGGLGALRFGFDHPEIFGGLASLEAGIDPTFSFDQVTLRHRFYRDDAFFKVIYGDPVDRAYWQRSNPANMVLNNRKRILDSRLQIYIDVGDQDMLHLDESVEFLHRVMWDHGIPHEYRLVHGANHVGRSLPQRFRDGFRFLTQNVLEPLPQPDPGVVSFQPRVDALKRQAGFSDTEPRPPLPPTSP